MRVRFARLALLLICIAALPAQAAAPTSLRIFSVNDRGVADLLPGARVQVVIELRSADLQDARLTHAAPAGLVLEAASVSSGAIAIPDMYPRTAPAPFVLWTGVVSATQPINLVLTYRVPQDVAAGDRVASVSGQAGGVPLAAATLLRVCCIESLPAQRPPGTRILLPVIRR